MWRVLAVCWVVSGIVFGGLAVASIGDRSEPEMEVSIYLVDDVTDEQAEAVRAIVAEIDGARDVTYVSKEDAFAEYREIYADQPALTENVTAEVLPASVRATANDSDTVVRIRKALNDVRAVDEITDNVKREPQDRSRSEGFDIRDLLPPQPSPTAWEKARNAWGIGVPAILLPVTAIAAMMSRRRGRRPCPECAESIKIEARRCPHCGSLVATSTRSDDV